MSTISKFICALLVSSAAIGANAAGTAAPDSLRELFRFISADGTFVDTLYVDHRRQPHFESLDCPASMFHTLQQISVRAAALPRASLGIDSVSIVNPKVQYQDVDNLKVYLRAVSQ